MVTTRGPDSAAEILDALTEDERDVVEAVARAVLGMRAATNHTWREIAGRLVDDGWEVRSRVAWVAEARRGAVHETAVADSREAAFAQLLDMTVADAVEGCP
jgi:hypothetical protein